ncbi:hypothetical protein ACJ7K1_16265 [Paenibacillus elgii]
MTPDTITNRLLQNQSLVRFHTAGAEQVAYSNMVVTPLVGPILTLNKSALAAEASLGQIITYRITITNTGNKSAQVTLVDALPAGTSFIANSVLLDGVPMPGIDPVSGIPLGTVQVERLAEIVFQVIVISIPAGLQLRNQAEARYTFLTEEGRVVSGSAMSNYVTIPVKSYLLSSFLRASTEYTFIGDNVTYGITLINEGNETIQDLLVRMPLPPGAQWVPGSVVLDDIHAPSLDPTAGIPIGVLAPGAFLHISFRLHVIEMPSDSQIVSQADIQYTVGEQSLTAQTNTVKLQVFDPGLSVISSVNDDRATLGDTLKYEIIVSNNGTLAVEAVLSLVIPKETLFVWDSIYVNGTHLMGAKPSDSIRLGVIKAGSQALVAFEVSIPHITTTFIPIIQYAANVHFTFRLPDGRLVQKTAVSNTSETELVFPLIQLQASVDPNELEMGDTAEYRVEAANKGNWPAEIKLTELIPQGALYVDGSPRKTVAIATEVSPGMNAGISLGTLTPGSSIAAFYKIRVIEDNRYHRLQHVIVAQYRYELNGRFYTGEARSNGVTIVVYPMDE